MDASATSPPRLDNENCSPAYVIDLYVYGLNGLQHAFLCASTWTTRTYSGEDDRHSRAASREAQPDLSR